MFREFTLFALLLLVHECGHFLTGYLLGWKVDKICFYPYGGCSKFITKVNEPLYKEFLVLIMGPIIQTVFYFILSLLLVRSQDITCLTNYHYGILLFNLLPIYPLDGGKLISILLALIKPYQKSFELTLKISFFFLIILLLFSFINLFQDNLLFLVMLLFSKLLEEAKKKHLYYQKFLLERYLEPVYFKKRAIIISEKDMYRDRKHLIKKGQHYMTEQEFLRKKFLNKW
ncbi:MAG: site-2 protease family protein [Bacilli bacterium]